MKKLFFIFLCIFIVSCNFDSSVVDKIAFENNASDSDFLCTTTIDKKTGKELIDVCVRNNSAFLNGYRRVSGESGVIGTWELIYDTYEKEVTLYNDGTFKLITTREGVIDRDKGTFEVLKEDDIYYIIIKWSTREYKLRYFVSDNYFCPEDSSCPV